MRLTTANTDFARGGDRALVKMLTLTCDVLFVQEAKSFRLALVLPKGWKSLQRLASKAKAGAAIGFNTKTASVQRAKLTLGVKPFLDGKHYAMLTRHIAWADIAEPTDCDRAFRGFSVHFPPKRFSILQPLMMRRLKAEVRKAHSENLMVVIGGDFNMPIEKVAKALGLKACGEGIVGFLTSPRVKVEKTHISRGVVREGLSDHPAVTITIQTPERNTVSSARRISIIAKTQVGYHEGFTNGHWNNAEKYASEVPGLEWANGQPWCAVFVSWCAMKARLSDLYPRTASCDAGAAWFKQRKQWSEYPAIGAQVFYGSPADLNHTGLVVDYDDDTITTIEGNTNDSGSREGDGVYRKVRRRRDANVVGYGYPAFPEGIKSADPNHKEHK